MNLSFTNLEQVQLSLFSSLTFAKSMPKRAAFSLVEGGRPVTRRRHSDSSSSTTAAARQAQVLGPIGEDETMESPIISGLVPAQAEANDADDSSIVSAMSLSTELYKKFLPAAVTLEVPKDFESVEMKILEVQDLADLPTVDRLLEEIVNNPRRSILVQMGEKRLQKVRDHLSTECCKWEYTENGYAKLEADKFVEEQEVARLREAAAEKLKAAHREYHALDVKYFSVQNSRQANAEKKRRAHRNLAIGLLVRDVVVAILDRDHLPWQNKEVEAIKEILSVHSWSDCKKLRRAECLAICHILDLFGYDQTDFFQNLFDLPPDGMSRVDFFDAYGPNRDIKSGKDSNVLETLQKRVAHYLGLTTNEEVSVEDIRAEYEELQRRQAHLEALLKSTNDDDNKNGAQG